MQIYRVIWKEKFVDKIESKHEVFTDEIEQILFGRPHVRREKKGNVKGEDLYLAYGTTDAGRYLIVFFIYKPPPAALPISARTMTESEKRYYDQQKKSR
ncbi:MAG: BrnT family toxin [Chloroflexi bacterium]|nr:BrnT family toxin [Chloroflexota bacterium]